MSYEKKKRVTIPGLVFLMFLFIGILIGIMPLTGTTAYGETTAQEMPVDGTCLNGSVSNSSNDYCFDIPC